MHSHPKSNPSRPFLKWAGGKQRLLSQLLPLLPEGSRLIEPFLGAGSVFLGSSYPKAVIGDANPDLVAVWTAIRERPREFCERASALFSEINRSDEAYRRIRTEYNSSEDRFERAIRFIYLNKFGFNGLYRVNQKGHFNVPYAKLGVIPHFPFEEVEAASRKLRSAMVVCSGFRGTMSLASRGDVVYCDPPYLALDAAPSFVGYTKDGFGQSEQQGLVEASIAAVRRGATVLISNHDTPTARELYRLFHISEVSVRRSVSAAGASRGMVSELVATLTPEGLKHGPATPASTAAAIADAMRRSADNNSLGSATLPS
jgi:DNA adenine methylase